MRIVLVASSLHPVPPPSHGAIETQVAAQALGLAARGHEVHVLGVDGPSGAPPRPLEGVIQHGLGRAFEGSGSGGARALFSSLRRFGRGAAERIRVLSPDVVHWHARYPCLFGTTGRSRRDPWPHLIHAHNWKRAENMRYDPWSTRRAAAALGGWIDARVARRCSAVLAVSAFVRDHVLADTGIDPDRAHVVTNVVDAELFRTDAATPRDREILFVGRIAAEKGLETLIEAVALVREELPDVRLTIVGPSTGGTERGSYERDCRELVARLGLQAEVRFAGPVPNTELARHLAGAAVLAVPSVWGEPCGVVALEGLASGTPVVASRVGGLPELIEEGVTGRLVEAGAPAAWARALAEALRDDALRASAATAGPAAVRERHSPARVGQVLEEIYATVRGDA